MNNFDATSPLLPEILSLHGRWRTEQDAVICAEQRLSWQQFIGMNHRFANGLLSRGIKPGDAVGIIMSNGIPMLQALMGVMSMGAVSVPINLSVSDDGIVGILKDSGVVALVISSDQRARLDTLKDKMPKCLTLYICDQPSTSNWVSIDELTLSASDALPSVEISGEDRLNIIYSSGTTGQPKGIIHTQAGRRDWAYDLAIALRYHSNSRALITIGLYSNISWVAMLTTLLAGGTLVIHKRFDTQAFLSTLEAEKITHTAMVPIQFQRVLEEIELHSDKYDLSSMHAMMSCGSPLHEKLKQKIFEYFPCGITELYGLTEGVITTIEPEQAVGRWSSVGKPLIGTDIRIINDDDVPLPSGQSGEIVSRGRITMAGYLNQPKANNDACYIDDKGYCWLRTGDIGYLDKDGFLYIVDRKKDMILSGGQNIYPQDIEAVIFKHPAVNDNTVFAAPSKKWGETPIALVVLNKKTNASAADIMQWSNQSLGKQQRIAEVFIVDKLPRNPNGKVLKRELRNTYSGIYYD